SAHDVPFVTGVLRQPRTGSQLSVVHGLLSLQLSAVPAVQAPLWQVSIPLQTVPSGDDVPVGPAAGWAPFTGSHEAIVQGLLSLQLSAVPAVQTPLWHVSLPLQTVPSAHDVPFGAFACWQPFTGSQESTVHGLPSLQLGPVPAVQTPLRHVSV